ncbi:SCO family protein [Streptomyces ipomoeae]|uniref:SCO family protein n=1 Tax=Streptomyces ipomoeae TaxID=103232 RepID=UPI0011469F48|nr:SCO family protein [Streptomyces ipomoeae]MDX2937758.1 SCO family protein [Streptomyces ipomoeae]TQE17237.1 SCO family protein [Streptomyces ipomoeae]
MNTPTAPAVPGGHFDLIDHHGNPVTPDRYRGRSLLVFFGFTHCADVCPRVLGRNTEALALLGTDADRFAPLYITVDPDRDTPEVMRRYLEGSHPRYTGLTGSPDQVRAAMAAYRVFARRVDDGPDDYRMPHTSFTYLLDEEGGYVTYFTETLTGRDLAARLTDYVTGRKVPAAVAGAEAPTTRGSCCS